MGLCGCTFALFFLAIGFGVIAVIDWVIVVYCLEPAERTYITDSCDISYCNIANTTSVSGKISFSTDLTFSKEDMVKTIDIITNYDPKYCNQSKIICYYYADDLSVLTIYSTDLEYTGMDYGEIVFFVVLFNLVCGIYCFIISVSSGGKLGGSIDDNIDNYMDKIEKNRNP